MQAANLLHLPYIRPLGRFDGGQAAKSGALPLFWGGSGVELLFTGTELRLLLEADFGELEPWIAVEVDGAPLIRMPLNRGVNEVCVLRGVSEGRVRRVRLMKDCQPMSGDPRHRLWVREVRWEGGTFLPLPDPAYRLEFVGDSLTSGEGVVGAVAEDAWVPALFSASRTWAKRTADLLNADFRLISQSGWGVRSSWDNNPDCTLPSVYDRVCGPASGAENESMGAQATNDFHSWRPDAVVINLGTNDAGAMGNPTWYGPDGRVFRQTGDAAGLRLFADAAADFLKTLRRHNPSAKLVWTYGMIEGPQSPALGPVLAEAVTRFRGETGDKDAYYLQLPAATDETIGSRQHPGPLCHQAAADATAEFLKSVLQGKAHNT